MSINWDSLLGGKYVGRKTATGVAPEATGAAPEPVETGEGATSNTGSNSAGKRSSGKSGKSAGNRK